MRHLRILVAGTALAASLAITAPVSADLPVIDVSNLKQSILTAAHTLEEVNNQITQIQQFVQMRKTRRVTFSPSLSRHCSRSQAPSTRLTV